ncbi:hypothetical protein GOP47_0028845 [Adiantum capillus-veneris]|nr:hypothetical protein GOP47_0028845 [Adiantum capillus-veneris]
MANSTGYMNLQTPCNLSSSHITFSTNNTENDVDFAFFDDGDEEIRSIPPSPTLSSTWWAAPSLNSSKSKTISELVRAVDHHFPRPIISAARPEDAINTAILASVINAVPKKKVPAKPNRFLRRIHRRRRCLPAGQIIHAFFTKSRSVNTSKLASSQAIECGDAQSIGHPPANCAIPRIKQCFKSSSMSASRSGRIADETNSAATTRNPVPAEFKSPFSNATKSRNSCAIPRLQQGFKWRSLSASSSGGTAEEPSSAIAQCFIDSPQHLGAAPRYPMPPELKSLSLISDAKSGRIAAPSQELAKSRSVHAQCIHDKHPTPKAHASSSTSNCRRRPQVQAPISPKWGSPTNSCNRSPLHSGSKRSPNGSVLTHHMNYLQQRVDSHELARKTFLPYRITVLGC